VANPNFYPLIPHRHSCHNVHYLATVYQVQSNLRVPYTMEAAFSVERQITKNATVSVTYLNSRGEHQLFLRNANAPCLHLPAQRYSSLWWNTNIYQYNSGGVFEQNQVIANFRVSVGNKLSLFGFYSLNFANSDLGSGGAVSISSGGGGGGFGGAFGGGTSSRNS